MNEQFDNASQASVGEEASVPEGTITKAAEATRVCPNCKNTIAIGQKFCPNCGATVEEQKVPTVVVCTNCGAEIESETKFCPSCGKAIASPSIPVTDEKAASKKKIILISGIIVAAIVIAIIGILFFAKVPVDDIVLSESKIELKETETKNISCTVYPDNASDKTVTWTSSDSSVATVSSYGMIKAIGRGTCTITAQAGDHAKTITVTVKPNVNFEKLYDDYCSSTWATLGSDKSYLSVDTNPYDRDDGDYRYTTVVSDAIKKINKALNLPDSLYEDMMQTSWALGKQSETYENVGITVTWTYHPDKGLEITYKLINQ